MNKRIIAVLSLGFLFSANIFCMDSPGPSDLQSNSYELVQKEIPHGGTSIEMYRPGRRKTKLGMLSLTKAADFEPLLELPDDNGIQLLGLPEIKKLMHVLIAEDYDLKKTVLLADVYVFPESRGNGHGKNLIEQACKKVMEDEAIENIILILQPFEYKDNQPRVLADQPDYQEKVKKLIELYKKCGFKKIDEDQDFMILNNSEPAKSSTSTKE